MASELSLPTRMKMKIYLVNENNRTFRQRVLTVGVVAKEPPREIDGPSEHGLISRC